MKIEDFAEMTPQEISNAIGIMVISAYKTRHQKASQKSLEEIYSIFKTPAEKIKNVLKERYYK